MKTVLICGGRDYTNKAGITPTRPGLHQQGRDYTNKAVIRTTMEAWLEAGDSIIHGGAPGADMLAAEVAQELGIPARAYPADWRKHGRAAGPIRNQLMLDDGKPDIVVAFPGGKGTADMIRRAMGRVFIVTVA